MAERIVRIEVTGNRRTSRADILGTLELRESAPFDAGALRRDVRALWDLGFFDDVQVDARRTDAGLVLRFIVRERPAIRKVKLVGNDEVDEEDLREVIDVRELSILSVPQVRQNVDKLRDRYAEKGFFLAEVSYAIRPVGRNEVDVEFRIVEHSAVTVRRITFVGNRALSDDELKEVMATSEAGLLSFLSGAGTYRQEVFERDIALLTALYYDKGHLNVRISTPRVALAPDRQSIFITIPVEEGPRFRIGRIRVVERNAGGREVEPLGGRRRVRELVKSRRGEWFSRSSIGTDLQAVTTHYRDSGYANVNVEPATDLDLEHRIVHVTFEIERGPVVYIERIEVRGNSKTRDQVIRRELRIAEGRRYSETGLNESKRRVTQLGYFERVDFSTQSGSADDKIVVNIEIAERATGTFQVGAGFSSVENFIATAQISQQNLFGRGQSLTLQAQLSALRQLISLNFTEPYFLDTDWTLSTELFNQSRDYGDFLRDSWGGRLTFGYPIIGQDLRLFMSYLFEQVDVSAGRTSILRTNTPSIFGRLPLANLFKDGRTSSVRLALSYDARNDRIFPTSGSFHTISGELAEDTILQSENVFARYSAFSRWYFPLGLGLVGRINLEGGLVVSPTTTGVPIFERYFLGGIFDIRGFAPRTLGPRILLNDSLDPNSAVVSAGTPIGGNLQLVGNFEIEFPILEKVGIRGVVFIDVGNSFNLEDSFCAASGGRAVSGFFDPCGVDLTNLRSSWGFGFRWFSPLGPLRFEWGFPFKEVEGDATSPFEFTIGNFF
ncbi:MAG: outer membrane protein assembly factor BamA [Deltaproteobacteria bacterium]|nr:outer membrane protein assembly factor BamA [Deltaproteobacteria bacterium]